VALVARKAAVATLVVIGIVALALALWKLRVLLSLFFLGLVIAAAMRPGIEWLHSRRVPRGVGLAIHYLALAGVVAFLLWLVVPRAVNQVGDALGTVPTSPSALNQATKNRPASSTQSCARSRNASKGCRLRARRCTRPSG
jgi:predicted PurR-regulated permease PerM